MRKIAVIAVLLSMCGVMFAASWPSSGPSREVVTLVVCSNNKSPRLLAEVIQAESKQPYLLLPAPQSGDSRIFFIPAKGAAQEIAESKLDSFIRFLNPRRIVVLGDETFVPKRYSGRFDLNIPVFTVVCKDWGRMAEELTYMLNISSLKSDYKRLRAQLLSDAHIYRPISKPAPKTASPEAAPAETAPADNELLPAGNAEADTLPPVAPADER